MNRQMKRVVTAGRIGAFAVLISAGSLVAHHSLGNFDTTTPVHVTGTLVRFERINPHSVLFIDQKIDGGKTERWAVDGPSVIQLDRLGISKETLKAGDVIEVCGYLLKEGYPSQRVISTEPISASLKDSAPKSMTGRIMNGEMVVMPGGKKQSWSDYGQHHCFDADYRDMHSR